MFEHEIGGRKERFIAKYNIKEGTVHLKGVLRNPLELTELIEFLKHFDFIRDEGQESGAGEYYICKCESKKKRLIGKGCWFADWPVLAGRGMAFDILKCESCGGLSKEITATIMS